MQNKLIDKAALHRNEMTEEVEGVDSKKAVIMKKGSRR